MPNFLARRCYSNTQPTFEHRFVCTVNWTSPSRPRRESRRCLDRTVCLRWRIRRKCSSEVAFRRRSTCLWGTADRIDSREVCAVRSSQDDVPWRPVWRYAAMWSARCWCSSTTSAERVADQRRSPHSTLPSCISCCCKPSQRKRRKSVLQLTQYLQHVYNFAADYQRAEYYYLARLALGLGLGWHSHRRHGYNVERQLVGFWNMRSTM